MLKTSSGGSSGQSGLAGLEKRLTGSEPDDSQVPSPVLKATRCMLAGAVVTIVLGLFQVIVLLADRNALGSVSGKPPSSAELAKARRILEAMAQAEREGKGAVSLDGRLIDYASIRMAEALLKKAEAIPKG